MLFLLVLSASDPFKLSLQHEKILPEGLSEYRALNFWQCVTIVQRHLREGCLNVGIARLGDLVGTSKGFGLQELVVG